MKLFDKYAPDVKQASVIAPGVPLNVSLYRTYTGTAGSAVDGDVGLELEVEGRDLPSGLSIVDIRGAETGATWRSIADGSLRGESCEYVLSTPCKTSELRAMVGGLFDKFKKHDTRLNNSNRCSTHVHVNVQDLKLNQITSVLCLWSTFSSAFIRWCGEDRVSNHFCLSTVEEDAVMDAWEMFLTNGRWPTDGNLKYSALNVLPILSLGSLEFRCGAAPDEADKVVYWAKICNAIVRYAAETYPNPMQLSYAMSELGPRNILKEVLEFANLGPRTTESIFEEICAQTDVAAEAFAGFRIAQPLIAEPDWEGNMEEINREFVPSPFKPAAKKRPAGGRLPPMPMRMVRADELQELLEGED